MPVIGSIPMRAKASPINAAIAPFGANENGPTFANQKDPTRMAVGLTPAADDFI
jgi:hypothetical protein